MSGGDFGLHGEQEVRPWEYCARRQWMGREGGLAAATQKRATISSKHNNILFTTRPKCVSTRRHFAVSGTGCGDERKKKGREKRKNKGERRGIARERVTEMGKKNN